MKRKKSAPVAPEWSYVVDAAEIGSAPERLSIEAGPEERAALARRFGVVSLESLAASLVVTRNSGLMAVHVEGRLKATLTQSCVVTSDPVQSTIEADVEGWFAEPGQAISFARARQEKLRQRGGEETPLLEEKDDPEPIEDGLIDVGELVAQFLSLAIDPYPHKEGVGYEYMEEEQAASQSSRRNPFAALKEWKEKRGQEDGEV